MAVVLTAAPVLVVRVVPAEVALVLLRELDLRVRPEQQILAVVAVVVQMQQSLAPEWVAQAAPVS